ncbi:HNH endonuclease [Streptomyces sp. A3M-1-3]|uniref:HNH endonuclease n=1 Tax=Streptomyces sp. A3M-1-3 TaxID=2962044 RepID=UPI0020B8E51B|nr:HNH endonuclease signature motif containing protein [Streptomyces sp. A3M-1-3]MCP3817822.1 HNH endonuclease [Streptomyces sp. A3M-1-3]
MAGRTDLTSHAYRKIRARILAESDVCILCGHGAADAVDHITPVSKGGAPLDPDNLAPIHGVGKCPTCLRSCNSEKSNKPLAQVTRLVTSRDWYAE